MENKTKLCEGCELASFRRIFVISNSGQPKTVAVQHRHAPAWPKSRPRTERRFRDALEDANVARDYLPTLQYDAHALGASVDTGRKTNNDFPDERGATVATTGCPVMICQKKSYLRIFSGQAGQIHIMGAVAP